MPLRSLFDYIKNRQWVLFLAFLYTALVMTVILHRFWQYETFFYDHGLMEETAYRVSQGEMPFIHRNYGRVWVYVDHLYPSLQLVLAPFYWIWDAYEMPLIVMSIFTGISVVLGYEIARKYIKSSLMILALLLAYMFYIGTQNALIFMIHDVTLQMVFLMALFLAVIYRKPKFYYPLLLLNLGFKESVAITTLALGIGLFIFRPRWRKHALITIVISLVYGLLASKVIIPYFHYLSFGQWGGFQYQPEFQANPLMYIYYLFSTPAKRETIFTSLTTFGFLPLFSPLSLILTLQDFAQRFVLVSPNNSLRQGLNLHYNANLAVILFVGSVWGVKQLIKFKFYRKLIKLHALLIILIVFFYHRIAYHGPLGLAFNPEFYRITQRMEFMDNFVAQIPTEGKLMIQNNLAVRFTHKDLYLLLSEKELRRVKPDVVALDFRPGQNTNNYWPLSASQIKDLAEFLINHPSYKIHYQEPPYRYIFVKN